MIHDYLPAAMMLLGVWMGYKAARIAAWMRDEGGGRRRKAQPRRPSAAGKIIIHDFKKSDTV